MTNITQAFRQPPMVAALYAELLPENVRQRAKQFFAYNVDFLPLAALGNQRQTIQIQNDSDFYLIQANGRARSTAAGAAAITDVPATVEIVSSGSGRQLFNRATDWDNIFGTAQLPYVFPYPYVLERASELATTLVDLSNVAKSIRISYIGFKVFDWPAAPARSYGGRGGV